LTKLRVINGNEQKGEQPYQWNLRPTKLDDYIGQHELIQRLQIALAASRQRGEPLDHILLYGPPGLGKTTLAHIISNEMESSIVCTSGPSIERSGDLLGILTNLQFKDILFVDEIHRLPRPVEEFLYSAMEDFKVDFIVDKGAFAKTIKLTLNHFTLIGATTRAGLLSSPLRDRFGIIYHTDFYSPAELTEIVNRSSKILRIPLEANAAQEIAKRSRGTPRVANRLLKRVRDYAEVKGNGKLTFETTRSALGLEGIDEAGLDTFDQLYLRTLIEKFKGGPAGLEGGLLRRDRPGRRDR